MALTSQLFASRREFDTVNAKERTNLGSSERIGSVAAGAGLLAFAICRRSWGGLLLGLFGGALILRGTTGRCGLYQRLGINSAPLNDEVGVPGNKGIKVTKSIVVNRPPAEVYRYWRNLENLPRFMEHVESVREMDQHRSHWTVRGPAGSTMEWTALIISDHEGEMIAWESLPGAEVQNAGSVWFEPVNHGSGTSVKVTLQYQPPAGAFGAAVAKLFGEAPDQQLENDLERFRQAMDRESSPLERS